MITISENIDLKPLTTFSISSRCDRWIDYTEAADIPAIMAEYGSGPVLSIGGGSNMLFTRDFHGTVIHSRISGMTLTQNGTDCIVTIGAGERFDAIIELCCLKGLWGIENLSGIPGDAGAAAVQNIGAYGVEIKDLIETVSCYDTHTGKFISLRQDECEYGYRTSVFKHSNRRFIVTDITLKLTNKLSPRLGYSGLCHLSETDAQLTPSAVRDEVLKLRDSKLPDPKHTGNAGSFFKNPVIPEAEYDRLLQRVHAKSRTEIPHYVIPEGIKIPAAWLIERCGFKGYTAGNAGVWHKQPLVLINATGNASGQEIIDLENEITEAVSKRFGIQLHPEVEHI